MQSSGLRITLKTDRFCNWRNTKGIVRLLTIQDNTNTVIEVDKSPLQASRTKLCIQAGFIHGWQGGAIFCFNFFKNIYIIYIYKILKKTVGTVGTIFYLQWTLGNIITISIIVMTKYKEAVLTQIYVRRENTAAHARPKCQPRETFCFLYWWRKHDARHFQERIKASALSSVVWIHARYN